MFKYLGRPAHDVASIFDLCVSNLNEGDRRDRLVNAGALVRDSSAAFDRAAGTRQAFLLEPADLGNVLKEDLLHLYERRFVEGPGRSTYFALRDAPPYGRCPLCGVGTIAQLDHVVPKTHCPELAITPTNLVPCCHWCNDEKGTKRATSAGEQILHPYFDDLGIDRWFFADLVGPPHSITIRFRVEPPPNWPQDLREMTQNHFRTLALAKAYASHTSAELSRLASRVRRLHKSGGSPAVRQHLCDETLSYAAPNPNTWQHAMYDALSADSWFCDGGFETVAHE